MQNALALLNRIEDITGKHRELRYSLTRAPALMAELDAIMDAIDDVKDTAAIEARVDYIERELAAYAGEAEEGESDHAMQRAVYHANVL